MGQILIFLVFYAVCAVVVLVWSTLREEGVDSGHRAARPMVRRVAISDYLLVEWADQVPDLVILDVHVDRGIGEWDELAPHWIPVRLTDLSTLLNWLPSGSMVVFCCREATKQLDTRSETALLQAGIGTIYFLDDSPVFQANHCCDHDVLRSDGSRGLRDVNARNEARRMT